jgi:hypothetical protein
MLHVIPQHQLLGIRMEVDLLAPLAGGPFGHRAAVVVMPEQRQGHNEQRKPLS